METLHSRPIATPETCQAAFHHDRATQILSLLIIIGLIISYLPQHIRIIRARTAEGLSAGFLLLGATSSACSLLNMLTLQWGQIICCQYLTAGQCFESVLGIGQVFFQWLCFNLIFILYLVYYPPSHKFVKSLPLDPTDAGPSIPSLTSLIPSFFRTSTPTTSSNSPSTTTRPHRVISTSSSSNSSSSSFDPSTILLPGQLRQSRIHLSPEYRHALYLFAIALAHLILCALTTGVLLGTLPTNSKEGSPPAFPGGGGKEHPSERAVRVWANVLGISSAALGCAQYFPQLLLTLQRKLVGSLSIPMMILQTPGSFVFVYTLAVRPGVNWTGYAPYLVTGFLQGLLLTMCIIWKGRQKRLGVDDWGRPLGGVGVGAEAVGVNGNEREGERRRLLG